MRFLKLLLLSTLTALAVTSCGGWTGKDTRNKLIVSVRDQRMVLVRDGNPVKSYKISTSKFGEGDRPGSNRTPLGRMEVVRKIGDKARPGTVFRHRRPTNEIVRPNAPGRDPIVSRILWLRGTERQNRHAFARFIYIHGTTEECRLGTPASYGCIRMGGRDVIDLYNRIGVGADVFVTRNSIARSSAPTSFAASH